MKKASALMTGIFMLILFGLLVTVTLQQDIGILGTQEQDKQEQESLASYSEVMKEYAYHSLRTGSTRADFENAKFGAGKEYWTVASCPDDPGFLDTYNYLMTSTRAFSNSYLLRTRNYDFGGAKVRDSGAFAEIEILVDESGVVGGDFDERYLVQGRSYMSDNANLRDPLVIEGGENEREFMHSYVSEVWPVRYWYMWRIIKQWIDEYSIPDNTCKHINGPWVITTLECDCPQCGGCPKPFNPESTWTIKGLLDTAVANLESRFDGNVDCSVVVDYQSCDDKPYIGHPENCEYGCKDQTCRYMPRDDPYCYSMDGEQIAAGAADCKFKGSEAACGACTSTCHGEDPYQTCLGKADNVQIEYIYTLECVDNKYQSPVYEEGFTNLLFRIKGHISMKTALDYPIPQCCYPDHYSPSTCSYSADPYGNILCGGGGANPGGSCSTKPYGQEEIITYSNCPDCTDMVTETVKVGCGM